MTSLQRMMVPLALTLLAKALYATPILSIHANGANLNNLIVGQTVRFEVALSEIPVGDELDSLSATVNYDRSLLGPSSISPGEILPDPLHDSLDFVSSGDTGIADGAFLTLGTDSADHISSNGTFFSFDVAVESTGAGELRFDFVGATQFNMADPNSPLILDAVASAPLQFVVVVPEPSTVGLLLASSVLFLTASRRYRHKAIENR